MRIVTDFGEGEALPSETVPQAERRIYEQWERAAFERGGWKGMSAEEFESRLARNDLCASAPPVPD